LDGKGNLCDADLNNDQKITSADLVEIQRCQGADLHLDVPLNEPGQPRRPIPEESAILKTLTCEGADLDGNGRVDGDDYRIPRSLSR
jgi:hypothetical protein